MIPCSHLYTTRGNVAGRKFSTRERPTSKLRSYMYLYTSTFEKHLKSRLKILMSMSVYEAQDRGLVGASGVGCDHVLSNFYIWVHTVSILYELLYSYTYT